MKKALITGITGQDGSYLAELLLDKGYEVHGLVRRSSTFNADRLNRVYQNPQEATAKLTLHHGDVTDGQGITNLVLKIQPDEIYNLAAQSHTRVSFDSPVYTANVVGVGTLNVLEAARKLNKNKPVRVYQASSSEIFGRVSKSPLTETTPFYPQSPYACAKVFAYHQTVNYRNAYSMFAVNGILFDHESPRRSETFVTRKITRAAARIKLGLQDKLYLCNLDSQYDWGFAKDYVEGMWLMLQADQAEDFVLATGKSHSICQFLDYSFEHLDLNWHDYVDGDPRYHWTTDDNLQKGDYSKAKSKLGWEPKTSCRELAEIMVDNDLEIAHNKATTTRPPKAA